MTTRWHKSPQLNERLGSFQLEGHVEVILHYDSIAGLTIYVFIVVLELVKRFEYKLRRLVTLASSD